MKRSASEDDVIKVIKDEEIQDIKSYVEEQLKSIPAHNEDKIYDNKKPLKVLRL